MNEGESMQLENDEHIENSDVDARYNAMMQDIDNPHPQQMPVIQEVWDIVSRNK